MFGRGNGKCFFCRTKFSSTDVPRNMRMAAGNFETLCAKCFNAVDGTPLHNVIAHPPKPEKVISVPTSRRQSARKTKPTGNFNQR